MNAIPTLVHWSSVGKQDFHFQTYHLCVISRFILLSRLAVANLSMVKVQTHQSEKNVTSLDAQLVSMESYINPDVSEALRFRKRHQDMVGEAHIEAFPVPDKDTPDDTQALDLLGVALIQPVTSGLEVCEIKRELFPTTRSASVNIEPVSTMLSFEDLQLIELVFAEF